MSFQSDLLNKILRDEIISNSSAQDGGLECICGNILKETEETYDCNSCGHFIDKKPTRQTREKTIPSVRRHHRIPDIPYSMTIFTRVMYYLSSGKTPPVALLTSAREYYIKLLEHVSPTEINILAGFNVADIFLSNYDRVTEIRRFNHSRPMYEQRLQEHINYSSFDIDDLPTLALSFEDSSDAPPPISRGSFPILRPVGMSSARMKELQRMERLQHLAQTDAERFLDEAYRRRRELDDRLTPKRNKREEKRRTRKERSRMKEYKRREAFLGLR